MNEIKEDINLEIPTVREVFEKAIKRGYVDFGLIKWFDEKEMNEIIQNINSEELKKQIQEFREIDKYEVDIAFQNLKKAIENDDPTKHDDFYGNTSLVFKWFQFWCALRQIPIKTVDLYMYMGKNQGFEQREHLSFKNMRLRTYIHIKMDLLQQEYKSFEEHYQNLKNEKNE